MRINKKLMIGMFFLVGILLVLLLTQVTLAQSYTRSSPQYTSPGANSINYLGGQGINILPSFSKDSCQDGQDFILQIAPFGCTPSVVRSDLLEEQNVPVFCQLAATKINPLIKVDAIDSISFSGDIPEGVSGIGFHPAKAAISLGRTLLNSPILENIGYAVIVLEQNKNESSMPDFINGTLTANIRYDIKNAFGVGKATQYLPELSDEDWNQQYARYGFWDGKGFLRSEGIDNDGAVISIYSDKDNKLSTFSLSKGETSGEIYLPGFYCAAGLKLRLDNLENPDTRARLNINGEIVEVADGEKFLENKCTINNIKKLGITEEVGISCRSDDGFDRFDLKINPTLKLEIDGVETEVNIGGRIFQTKDLQKSVYLGYAGTKGNSGDLEDLFLYFVAIQTHKENLTESELSSLNLLVKSLIFSKITHVGVIDFTLNVFKVLFAGLGNLVTGYVFEGREVYRIDYDGQDTITDFSTNEKITFTPKFKNKEIKIIGFVEPTDSSLRSSQTREYYENAILDYREIINKFPNEKNDKDSQITYGREALSKAIRLSFASQQRKTTFELCQEFSDAYKDNKADVSNYCGSEFKFASTESTSQGVLINNNIKIISFEGISEPGPDEFSAEISVRSSNGELNNYVLRKNQVIFLNVSENEFIRLVSLERDFARVEVSLRLTAGEKIVQSLSQTIRKLERNIGVSYGSKYSFTLTKVNLKKVAKVSVLPNINNAGTKANFSFRIGIEKRAIQLSPDQINERLETINKTIERWEGISDDLGNVVKGFNAACLAVGTTLTIKNLFQNVDGRAIARQEVMRSSGGWMDLCKDKKAAGEFKTIDQCLLANSEQIDEAVDIIAKIIKEQEGITNKNIVAKLPGIRNLLGNEFVNPDDVNESINITKGSNVGEAFTKIGFDQGKIGLTQAKDLERLQTILNSNPNSELEDLTKRKIFRILSDIQANSKNFAIQASTQSEVAKLGIGINTYGGEKSIQGVYAGGILSGSQIEGIELDKDKSYPVEILVYNNKQYVVLLQGDGSKYYIDNEGYSVYRYKGVKGTGSDEKLVVEPIVPVELSIEDALKQAQAGVAEINTISSRFSSFILYDRTTYINKFKNPQVRFFETEPYKGLPAIVPFDTTNGWYAATKQTLDGFGNIRSYDDSGRITSFYLCNVGKNGREEFNSGSGFGDDICQSFNPGTGQLHNQEFQGLDPSETKQKISQAIRAIKEASAARQRDQNLKGKIKILNEFIDVGNPAAGVPDIQCQDFMSPDECNLLFNTCDPVVCPSSRCNLGGAYHVPNVIQSGIVGSIALCLPNIREDIYVPICLSGVKAGVDSFISVQENYRDCLQTNLETGETIGICDEIHSIYLCDFFWSQAQPFANLIVPKLFESFTGQTGRGGGEYLGVQSAWKNAGDSVDYLTNYYGASSFEAFRTGIVRQLGNSVCQNFVSASYPSGMDFFDSLIEPESPPQYTAWFSEALFTSATVPPTSRYKVFYHIFAGEENARTATGINAGAFYNVFLKTPTSSSFYQYSPTISVASGFIPPGDFASETKDFTAPSGYQELCVSVNNQEECGFNRVTTEFALDYVNDLYLAEQSSQTNINSERDCISGTPSLYSFINPNLQAGLQDFVDPSLYTEQIVRVCSTDNPGQGTDSLVGTKGSRWVEVGTCDPSGNLKCYLDQESVKKVIKSTEIRNEILGEVSNDYVQGLKNEGEYIQDFQDEFDKLSRLDDQNKILQITSKLISRAFLSVQKAKLILLRADAYAKLALDKVRARNVVIDLTCTETKDCQKNVGKFIIEIVNGLEQDFGIRNIDQSVRDDGVAQSFECLILQIAMQESSIQQCKKLQENRDPLYCDARINDFKEGDDKRSKGIMQINLDAHGIININDIDTLKENVEFAVNNVLVPNYQKYNNGGKYYGCKNVQYTGWQAAIRGYNGWNTDCSKGNINYVEEVIGKSRRDVGNLFPECGGSVSSTPARSETRVQDTRTSESGKTRLELLQDALEEAITKTGYYSDNKVFVDRLCGDNLLTLDQCDDIDGLKDVPGDFWEEEMPFVVEKLIENIREERGLASSGSVEAFGS